MHVRFTHHHAHAIALLVLITLMATIATPIAAQIGDEAPPPEVAEDPVVPTEPPAEPTAEPALPPTEPVAEQPEPTGVAAPPTGVSAAQAPTNRLTISAFRCAATYWSPTHFTRKAVSDRCPEPGTAAFTVESDFGTENASGTTFAFNVRGDLTITETNQQQGFDDPIVYCDVYGPDGTVAHQRGPIEPHFGEYHYGTVANDIHCDWYQLDRSQAKLSIVNMACPPSAALAPTPTMAELVTMCTDPAGPVSFSVSDSNYYFESSTSGGEFNQAYFGDVPYDRELTISADPPATFASARVFCQFSREDQFHEMEVLDFGFTQVFRRVKEIHCNWFNIAQGPGLSQGDDDPTVVPTPPTQSPGLSQGDDDPAIVPTATSQPGGSGLSQGNSTPTPVDPTQPTPTPGPGLSNGTTPVPSATVPPQPSTLIISMYTCPAGYAPEATTTHPFTDCIPGPAGVTVTLTDSDPATVDPQSMTGDVIPNAVQFGGLVPGNYTITETLSPSPASTFVLGCGGSGTSPVLTVVPGSHIIQIPAATLLTCYWFNIPPPV